MMQIRSNPYPIAFDRVDNALEAMAAPSADAVAGLITGRMLDRAPVVDIHNTISSPDGTRTEMEYRLEKTWNGIRVTGHAGGQPIEEFVDMRTMNLEMQGRIGQSAERLTIAPTIGGFVYRGQIGDVPLSQQVALNPFTLGFQLTGQFGPVMLQAVGQPTPDGTSMAIQGQMDGRPFTGSIQGGAVENSMLVTREVDGYHWIQEIRGQAPPPPQEPAPPTYT